MSAPAGRPLSYVSFGVATAAAAIGLALLLLKQTLDDADKIASVISLIVGIASLTVGTWSVYQSRRAERPESERFSARGTGPSNSTSLMPGFQIDIRNAQAVVNGHRNKVPIVVAPDPNRVSRRRGRRKNGRADRLAQ